MSFASDKLYKGYLRRNMPTIASKVKVREIVPHLPCLTDHDRENIEAKREVCGNYDSMMLLLDCLKRRENWPEQFITALEVCDQPTLAAEIRAEYDTLRGTNNSNPSSPSTTVIRAHVHPAPSASHLPIPESGANSQAAVALPVEASSPPEPAAQASPPLQQQPLQSPAAQVPEAVSPPEPVAEPPPSAAAPSTPPPSPATPHTQATATPPPQREVNSHQEPEENSESDIQDISGDNGVIPEQVNAGDGEVSISSVDTPQPAGPVEQCETDARTRPDPLQKSTTTTTQVTPPQSPSAAQINFDATDGSSDLTMTPDKAPVQDTAPPVDLRPAAQPEETSEPPATQVVESSPQTEAAATASPLPGDAGTDASIFDDDSAFLSKPGQLVSVQPPNNDSPTIPSPSSPVEPYSGGSERLEISEAASDAVTSAPVPACSAVSSATVNTASALPCQENGIALNHNEPEENHYESPCESLQMQSLREHVVQVSEEPSILNLDGQSSTPQAQIVNGEAPPLSTTAADTVSSVNNTSSENHHPSEPAPELQDSEEKTSSHTLPANTKYILTAAGVGACALLMAWKFKN